MVQSILYSYEQVIVRVAIEDLNFLMNLDLIEFGTEFHRRVEKKKQ